MRFIIADDAAVARATLEFIESRHGQLLLHAGGAATSDGQAVVVHGASGAGKTTLTTALVAQGLAYLTDETVCVDPQSLQIEPFRKPLTVKPGSQDVLAHLRPPADEVSDDSGNWQLPPERLGGPDLPDAPLRPVIIVFPDQSSEHEGVQVSPVSKARAAFVLGEQSSAMWAIEPRPLAAVARLVNAAPAFHVSYASAFDAAPVIVRDLLGTHRDDLEVSDRHAGESSPEPQDQLVVSDEPQPAPTGAIGPRRADGVDWLILDGEAVLFDGEHLHHLDVPGAVVWQSLDGERELPEIAEEIAEAFGADPDQVLVDVEDLVRVFRRNRLVA